MLPTSGPALSRPSEPPPEDDTQPGPRSSLLDYAQDSLNVLSNFISCETTLSYFKWRGATSFPGNKSVKGSVDVRGRAAVEITLTRRPHFLCGDAVDFSVPAVDDMDSTLCKQALKIGEAPCSGTWRGRYFDGLAWRQADFTLFFQDLIGRETGTKHSSGCSSLDIMGSCGSLSTTGCVAVVGSYSPDSGRVTWSQPAPPGDSVVDGAVWEVWAQLYASYEGGEQGQRVDRIFASYQDSNGKRGNMELVLCEGGPVPPFVVGNSFWSHTGLDLFVHDVQQRPSRQPRGPHELPQRPVAIPTSDPSSVRGAPSLSSTLSAIVPESSSGKHVPVTVGVNIVSGSSARAEARLASSSILDDPSHTLV